MLLVHGWPDTKRLWSKQVPALVDAGFQVITYDQRGYGASDKPAEVEAYSIPFLAIDATAVLDHLGIEQAHFVGHDWGAAVAWATAALAPATRRSSRRVVGRASERVREHVDGAAREVVVHAAVPVRAAGRAVAHR